MKYAIIDTETTGLPDWQAPSELPSQARIMELAALLYDDGRLLEAHSWLIEPENDPALAWPELQAEAFATHGITVKECALNGWRWDHVWPVVIRMISTSDRWVAFGAEFDARMIRIELKRRDDPDMTAWFKEQPHDCAMKMVTKLIRLPPTAAMHAAGRHHPKTASLGEALEHFVGRKFEQQHRALIDALATALVYAAVRSHKPGDTPAPKPLL